MMDTIRNPSGERIDAAYSKTADERSDLLVILGHGVTGNKDRPVLVETARQLNTAGFDTLRISFSGNGESEGSFDSATISKEVDDLLAVLHTVSPLYSRICYVGHSMGAAVGVIAAARDARIQFLVSIAGMADTRKFAETEFGSSVPGSDNMWDMEGCPLSQAFMKDLTESIGDVFAEARSLEIPWLLVHGTADDVVLPDDSYKLKEEVGASVELEIIEGADHVFSEANDLSRMAETITQWLNRVA